MSVFDDLTLQGTLFQISEEEKRSLTKRVHAHRAKTKKWKYQKGGFVNFKFSQVARSGRVQAVVAQKNEFVVYL